MKILITGGAGFVGSRLAHAFRARDSRATIVAFDNLKRRGSELNLRGFKNAGIQFAHGDIRSPGDLADLDGPFDLMIEASAEPSVLAGLDGSPQYAIQTNLVGTLNCLEYARRSVGGMIFLSTSRVYSMKPLKEIRLDETATRFEISQQQELVGVSARGVSESFATHLPRSIYGATKLASELMIQEYADTYQYPAIINRCGVIAGSGQFGKVDQGVFTLWVASHHFKKPLKYTGFGGTGKQVRDLLHPLDLFELLERQVPTLKANAGGIFNVGGGRAISTSMQELTAICREVTSSTVAIAEDSKTSSVDIPLYVSDSSLAESTFGWKPKTSVREIVSEIGTWIRENEKDLAPLFS